VLYEILLPFRPKKNLLSLSIIFDDARIDDAMMRCCVTVCVACATSTSISAAACGLVLSDVCRRRDAGQMYLERTSHTHSGATSMVLTWLPRCARGNTSMHIMLLVSSPSE
jgi:hypothetical protein